MKFYAELNSARAGFEITRDFAAVGYDSYRLLPGLNLLVPFDAESLPDSYLLNLFCCNAVRAAQLSKRGLLLRACDLEGGSQALGANASLDARYHWRHALAHLEYAIPARGSIIEEVSENAGDSATDAHGLFSHQFYRVCRSRDTALRTAERFSALQASFLGLKALCEREPSRLRLASLARVAIAAGGQLSFNSRLTSCSSRPAARSIWPTGTVDRSEPFLAPLERFDSIAPGGALGNWVLAAVLEQLEQRERYSSFYAGANALDRLEAIESLGFGSPSMARRLELVRLCIKRARSKNDQ